MWVIWFLLGLLAGGAIGSGAGYFVHRFEAVEHLISAFQFVHANWPPLTYEQFLATALAACVLVVICAVVVCAGALLSIGAVMGATWSKQALYRVATKREAERMKIQIQQDYERLTNLSVILTQRLDKSALLQNILQAARQMTSLARVESIVALWVLDFETDQMRFARGNHCDETFFTKTEFQLVEPPMAKLVGTQQALRFSSWKDGFPFLRPERVVTLGEASSLLLVPLVIERTVLGCLVIFCHPEILKSYEKQQAFFAAAWGHLALALGIGIQEELAILDRLTGLMNHAYFMKRLSQEIDRSNRYQLPLGLLMVDVDNFKLVNDTLGHPQGDAVLKIVAKIIRREVRAVDLVGRYGGEEFIVMLPETGSANPAQESSGVLVVGERIRKAVEEEFCRLQKPLNLTVSIGIAVRRPDDRHIDTREFVRLVDERLYKAKTAGKNRCSVAVRTATPLAS